MSKSCPESESLGRVIIWMTDSRGRHEHGVTIEAADSGVRAQMGIYESICGARFVPAPLSVPPRHRCLSCAARYEQPTTLRCRSRRSVRHLVARALKGGLR